MKFKVTEYEFSGGEERVIKEEYEITLPELKAAREGLQKLVCAGVISGYDISPIPEVQNDER